jgi:hypothetical protein
VHNGTSEAHLLAWLRGGVEWVVITVESATISNDLLSLVLVSCV